MKLLAEVIEKKHKGNISRFIRATGIDSDCKQVSRWMSYGCYFHRGEVLRPLAKIERE